MNNNNQILLIENEPAARKILADKLKREKFIVTEANNGLDGLALAIAQHPDLIILDIFMPKMTGVEVIKRLQQDQWGQQVPIIILTNITDDPRITEVIKNAHYDCLLKTNHDLASIITKIKSRLAV